MVLTVLTIAVSNGTDSGIEDEVFHQPDTDVVRSQARSCTDQALRRGHCAATLVTRLPTISTALCAGARRLESLSVTGFPSASVPGWHSSRLPTDYVGMADVSRRARGARPCPRHERMGWRLSAGRFEGLTLIAPADLPPSYKGAGD